VNKGSGRAFYLEANMGHLADVQLAPLRPYFLLTPRRKELAFVD
jgi:hypothetical protein